METKHTKVEWRQFEPFIGGRKEKCYRRITAGSGCYDKKNPNAGFELTGYISEENTKLIAAAPELLEALVRIKALYMNYQIGEYLEPYKNAWQEVDSAIKKATT